jgi:hypothetical protein
LAGVDLPFGLASSSLSESLLIAAFSGVFVCVGAGLVICTGFTEPVCFLAASDESESDDESFFIVDFVDADCVTGTFRFNGLLIPCHEQSENSNSNML